MVKCKDCANLNRLPNVPGWGEGVYRCSQTFELKYNVAQDIGKCEYFKPIN